jgi:hypothetical protein
MALKGDATTGDSLTFWNVISAKFASNPLVWYELYNEPFGPSYDVWLNGDSQYEGMKPMAAQVRANNIKGMILVAGALAFAYDDQSLIAFARDAPVDKVLFVFHPFVVQNRALMETQGTNIRSADTWVLSSNRIQERVLLASPSV